MHQENKKKELFKELIDKQFEIAGHSMTFEELNNDLNNGKFKDIEWYRYYTISKEQEEEFIRWGENYVKHKLKIPKKMATIQFGLFYIAYGLKRDDTIDD